MILQTVERAMVNILPWSMVKPQWEELLPLVILAPNRWP
jgi:hypothetical protein